MIWDVLLLPAVRMCGKNPLWVLKCGKTRESVAVDSYIHLRRALMAETIAYIDKEQLKVA
jgi:hypothetical protein